MKQKPIDFSPTEELTEQIGNTSAGDRLELMSVFAIKPDGRWCLVSIEGVPMPGYDQYGNPESGEDEGMKGGDFINKYNEAVGREED